MQGIAINPFCFNETPTEAIGHSTFRLRLGNSETNSQGSKPTRGLIEVEPIINHRLRVVKHLLKLLVGELEKTLLEPQVPWVIHGHKKNSDGRNDKSQNPDIKCQNPGFCCFVDIGMIELPSIAASTTSGSSFLLGDYVTEVMPIIVGPVGFAPTPSSVQPLVARGS